MSETIATSTRKDLPRLFLENNSWLFLVWVIFIGGYAAASFVMPVGRSLTAFGDIDADLALVGI